MQAKVKRLIKRLAQSYELTEEEVEKIVFAGFKKTKETFESATAGVEDTFLNVRIVNIGIFAVKPNRIKKLEENAVNRNERGNPGHKSSHCRD